MPLRCQSKKEYNGAYYQINKSRIAAQQKEYDATTQGKARRKECERKRQAKKRGQAKKEYNDSDAVAEIMGESAGARSMHDYFEHQDGAWCGMHALNNYIGGPYVTKDACRRAASRIVATLSQVGTIS